MPIALLTAQLTPGRSGVLLTLYAGRRTQAEPFADAASARAWLRAYLRRGRWRASGLRVESGVEMYWREER